jgi:hypothetical protein
MPKLSTTVDNLELKTNKVTATTPSSSWTDTQYPSAKALYSAYSKLVNIAHPVGSIMITSTNTNPGSSVGGTWELVDKGFTDRMVYIPSSSWTAGGAAFVSETNSILELADHTVSLRLSLTNTAALSDTEVTLGTLKLNTIGITELPYTIVSDITASDGGQCTLSYSIVAGGKITCTDVLAIGGSHSLAAGNTFSIHINQTVGHDRMLDSFCDKFYWKRTA